jgi:hypothetical protein
MPQGTAQAQQAAAGRSRAHVAGLKSCSKSGPGSYNGEGDGGGRLPAFPQMYFIDISPVRCPRTSVDRQRMTWTVVRASDVRPGDVLPDIGLVITVQEHGGQVPRWRLTGEDPALAGGLALGEEDLLDTGISIEITGEGGKTADYARDSEVRVFRSAS